MDNPLHEALNEAMSEAKGRRRGPDKRFLVVEEAYARKRIIYSTNDKAAADRVAGQHAARKVYDNG